MEMRIKLNEQDDKLAIDLAVAAKHLSKRRAVIDTFREEGPARLKKLRSKKSKP
jgi:hypothetical protein